MGLFKKLKKLHKKSVGGKLAKKDPLGRTLTSKDPVAKRVLGGGAQKAKTGPNMRHMSTGGGAPRATVGTPRITGGGAQRDVLPTRPLRTGGPAKPAFDTDMSNLAGRSRRGVRR